MNKSITLLAALIAFSAISSSGKAKTSCTFTVNISPHNNISCYNGSNGSAVASPSGGTSPYTYAWSNGKTTPVNIALTAGYYSVLVTDHAGCTATASVTLTQPSASLFVGTATVNSNVSCYNGSNGSISSATASGGTAVYTYLWNGGNSQTNVTCSILSVGTYTVSVVDAHGCTASASSTLTLTQPSALVAALTTYSVNCSGNNGLATYAVSGGVTPYTFSWSPSGGSGLTASGLTSGIYTFTATDAHGCIASASITITQLAATTSHVNACYGSTGSASVTATGGTTPYTYFWSPGSLATPSITGLSGGTYTVIVSDNHGCSVSASVTIIEPLYTLRDSIVTSATVNVSTYSGYNGSATVGVKYGATPYSYFWSPGGESSATATDLIAGSYTVAVTDNNGCTATTTVTITQPASSIVVTPLPTNGCINNDTMKGRMRWYVFTPDSSSMRITITNLYPTSGGHVHDLAVFEGTGLGHLYPISQPWVVLRNDTSAIPLTITLDDLFPGIPIYICISRGHTPQCSNCSHSLTAYYNICTQHLTTPTRTVDADGNVFYNGAPQYKANQVIIKFKDSILKLSAINNNSIVSGSLSTFIRSVAYSSLTGYLTSLGISSATISGITLKKVYPGFTLADSVTTSLQGRKVHNTDLWATFLMIYPSAGPTVNTIPYNEVQMSRLLSLVKAVQYAEPNGIGQLQSLPNDPYWSGQLSLADGATAGVDIDIEAAWTYSTGNPSYSIGIFDDGIDENHEDFNDHVLSNINPSNGYDYTVPGTLSSPYVTDGHGTAVAGIASALRNNSIGVAGIAGGDEPSSNPGCTLYDMKIGTSPSHFVAGATVDGAIMDGWKKFGIDIVNHSWGTGSYSTTLRDAVAGAVQNGEVFIGARGETPNFSASTIVYPACIGYQQDDLTISVGASGTDGQWLNITSYNETPPENTQNYNSLTQYVNVIAPGSAADVVAPQALSTTLANSFDGTSASCAHIAGTVGLMESYSGAPWCNEDAKNFIEMFASPANTGSGVGSTNPYAGFGRLNAGWIFANMQPPNSINQYASNDGVTPCSLSKTLVTPSATPINLDETINGLSAGPYDAFVYQYEYTLSYSLPGSIISNSSNPGYWPRYSSTMGLNCVYPDIDPDYWCNISFLDASSATVDTYEYDVVKYNTSSHDYDIIATLPVDSDKIAVAITILTGTLYPNPASVDEISTLTLHANIFPNPSGDYANIDYVLTSRANVGIGIYNSAGTLVEKFTENNALAGFYQKYIPLSDFSAGLYLVQITAGNNLCQKKLVVLK